MVYEYLVPFNQIENQIFSTDATLRGTFSYLRLFAMKASAQFLYVMY
jgi:hypothetical protein